MSALSDEDKYFLTSNCRSNSNICLPVNVVLAFFLFLSPSEEWPSLSVPGCGGVCATRLGAGGITAAEPVLALTESLQSLRLRFFAGLPSENNITKISVRRTKHLEHANTHKIITILKSLLL